MHINNFIFQPLIYILVIAYLCLTFIDIDTLSDGTPSLLSQRGARVRESRQSVKWKESHTNEPSPATPPY